MNDKSRVSDTVNSLVSYKRPNENIVGLKGVVTYKLLDEHGNVKQEGKGCNIVTTQGDNYFVDQLSDAGAATIKLMVVGTGTAAVAKADTWISGSASGSAATGWGTVSPVTNSGTAGNLQLVGTFAAGNATRNSLTRVGYTNINPSADGLGTPSGTTFFIAHGTLTPTVNKGALDVLVVTWDISFLGS